MKCSASITRYVGLAVCTRHPEDIVRAIIVGRPRHDKKQIGKTVEIFDSFYIDRLRRASSVTQRSARRATVRAKCSWAATASRLAG